MGKLFGTDGVRGIANEELTCDLAFKLARAGAAVLGSGIKRPNFVIGTDTRLSSDMLESAMVAGLCSAGSDAVLLGVVPTPAVAYLIRHLGADGGIVISASHNPAQYNGIKFFDRRGYKLDDHLEEVVEKIVLEGADGVSCPGEELGRKIYETKGARYYADFLKSTVSGSFEGMKVAVDCANGAASKVAPLVLGELGAEISVINDCPDGLNINVECGSTHPEGLASFVKEKGLDLGLAFDGDADRLIAVDHRGEIIDGDYIMAVCAQRLKAQGKLSKDTVAATVMSNLGLHRALENIGCRVEETKVGDKYVLQRMMEKGYSLGGEQSGHIIFLDLNTTGDGLLTALQLLETIKYFGKSLSELCSTMQKYPQVLVNVRVRSTDKEAYRRDPVIYAEIERIQNQLKGSGRVLIRPSGTEPLVRIMLEGQDTGQIRQYAENLAKLIETRLS
ncbi:MAG: phosphoglucosamine mutase [Clostridiales bacterium]|nr:phosphoglucosamine mutase [Clostridiales bacterium]